MEVSNLQSQPEASAPRTRLAWVCSQCSRECIPIRSESRCLCGHRHKEHAQQADWRCSTAKCAWRGFSYIVAEGSWVLRCRCKHKHVEHDAATHTCSKPGCGCGRFDSPWVCNCDHSWAAHRQVEVPAARGAGASLLAEAAADVNRWDLLRRGAAEQG